MGGMTALVFILEVGMGDKVRAAGDTLIKPLYEGAVKLSKGDPKLALNLYKLFMESANQESQFGTMSSNIMQIDPIQVEELSKGKYSDLLKTLDVKDLDINNPDTSLKLGMATFATRLKDGKYDLSTQEGRAKAWKDLYNTKAGKGTVDKYKSTNSIMDWTTTDEWFRRQNGGND
jgi:hypothetical protein